MHLVRGEPEGTKRDLVIITTTQLLFVICIINEPYNNIAITLKNSTETKYRGMNDQKRAYLYREMTMTACGKETCRQVFNITDAWNVINVRINKEEEQVKKDRSIETTKCTST